MLLRPTEKVIEGLKSVIETWINETNIILTNLLYVICICISVLRWMKTIHDPSQVSSWKEKYYRRVEKVRRINLKKKNPFFSEFELQSDSPLLYTRLWAVYNFSPPSFPILQRSKTSPPVSFMCSLTDATLVVKNRE